MNKLLLLLLLMAFPACAQAQTPSKGTATRADPCAPIGKTAKGELVYSMKCDNPPATSPSPSAAQVESREASPVAEPEARRGGLFGWSFDRRKPDE
jgi:hypothetical protein